MSELQLNPLAIMREEPDGTGVVLDPMHEQALRLNSSGVLLWNTIVRGIQREGLVKELVQQFDVAENVAEKDVQRFLTCLREKQLLNAPEQ